MALLLRDRETTAPDELVVVPDYACAACGAGMEAGQDWCLECGTAAPGRLGARPGWRAAATVVATTLLLVMGAVVASYAAISGDAQREAARAAPESADPIIAQTPPPAAPVLPTVPAPPATATPAVPAPVTPTPQATPAPSPPPPTPSPAPAGPSEPSEPAVTFSLLDLPAGSLRNYDPYDRAGAEIGPPGAAADGLKDTVWDVTVPADGEPIAVGLVVDLRKARLVESVRIDSPTPGYTVEVYGTDASGTPPDILDKRWDRLAGRRDAKGTERLDLTRGEAKGPFRRLVLWFTRAGDEEDPRVAVGEIGVRATR